MNQNDYLEPTWTEDFAMWTSYVIVGCAVLTLLYVICCPEAWR